MTAPLTMAMPLTKCRDRDRGRCLGTGAKVVEGGKGGAQENVEDEVGMALTLPPPMPMTMICDSGRGMTEG